MAGMSGPPSANEDVGRHGTIASFRTIVAAVAFTSPAQSPQNNRSDWNAAAPRRTIAGLWSIWAFGVFGQNDTRAGANGIDQTLERGLGPAGASATRLSERIKLSQNDSRGLPTYLRLNRIARGGHADIPAEQAAVGCARLSCLARLCHLLGRRRRGQDHALPRRRDHAFRPSTSTSRILRETRRYERAQIDALIAWRRKGRPECDFCGRYQS